MKFSELIGQTIGVIIPRIDPDKMQRVKLVGVESGGLWIESQQDTNAMLQSFNVATAPRTPVFFLPYHEIRIVMSSTDSPSLNEKSFGV